MPRKKNNSIEHVKADNVELTQLQKKINEMCKKLLVNLIIEDYQINKI